nr:glutamate-rich protein 3-like [Dermacentor andersoni]
MWMVAAAHKKCTGPIDSYDSSNDEHLRPHFHKSLVRQRLARVGLVRCLRHDGKPDDPRAQSCTCSLSGSRESPDATSTTSSGDSGVVSLRNADLTCATCRGGSSAVAAPPPTALMSEPVSPYLLPVNPSSKRKPTMPRPTQQAAGSRSAVRRASITPSTPASSREDLVGIKNHFPKKSDCKVSLLFRGSDLRRAVAEARQSAIRVTQQHCGGTSLTVFDSRVTPGATFTFASRRHCGYPFSIVVFVDDIRDIQLSSCCEYRYNVGTRLGGSQGHFSLAKLEGGSPCYRCVLEKRLKALPKEEPEQTPPLGSKSEESSGLSSPVTSSSEAVDSVVQSLDGAITNSLSSEEEYSASEDESQHSKSRQSSEHTDDEIADAAEKELYSSGTNYSSETSHSQSQLRTSESEDVGEQIEGYAVSSQDSTQTDNNVQESGTISNSFETYTSAENSGEKSVHSETGSHVEDGGQYNMRHNVAKPSVYFVQDKKKQWGSDECRGESFSSDDDAQTVTLTVKAEVHSTQ